MRVADPARRAVRPCLLAAALSLAACERPATEQARQDVARPAVLGGAISNPWSGPVHPSDGADRSPVSPSASLPGASPLASLGSPDPASRRAALDAWVQARPDSLQEIRPMLDDPDVAVRARARALWNAALSGGREAGPP